MKSDAEKAIRRTKSVGAQLAKKRSKLTATQFNDVSGTSELSFGSKESDQDEDSSTSALSWLRFYKTDDNETLYLRWREFFCFAICIRLNVAYLDDHVYLLTTYGPTLTLIVITVLSICLGLPLLMVYIFLSNYSSRCFIRIWDFVPLLKGIPYAVIYYTLSTNMYTVAYSAMAGRYVKELLAAGEIPWMNCQHREAHPDCVPTLAILNKTYDEVCCNIQSANCSYEFNLGKTPNDAVRDFFKMMSNMKEDESPRKLGLMWEWIAFDGFIYLLVLIFSILGLRLYRRYFFIILIVMNCSILPCFLLTLYYGRTVTSPGEKSRFTDLVTYNYWRDVIAQSLHMELPGEIMNFAATSPLRIGPTPSAVMIYIGLITANCLITVWVYMMFQTFKTNYNIDDYRCLDLNGRTFLFVHTVDVISRQYMGYELMIIYFMGLWLWGTICTILRYTAVVDALIDEFAWMKRHRIVIAAGLTSIMFAFSCSRMEDNFQARYRNVKTTVAFVKFILFFFIAQGLIVYSGRRISSDYQFTYNAKIPSFLIYGVKQFMLSSTICIVMAFNFNDPMLVNYPVYAICLMPIPIGMFIVIVQYLLTFRDTVLQPDTKWGPMSQTMRKERSWFDPTHALRHRIGDIRCKHKCLLGSANVKRQVLFWRTNQMLKREHFEEIEDDRSDGPNLNFGLFDRDRKIKIE